MFFLNLFTMIKQGTLKVVFKEKQFVPSLTLWTLLLKKTFLG